MLCAVIISLGLIAELCGVWLLAYDLIRGPIREWKQKSLVTQINNERVWLLSCEQRIEEDPLPLADRADNGQFLRESIEESKGRLNNLNDQLSESEQAYRVNSRLYGWRGVLLISMGAVIQIIGTLMAGSA